MIRICLILLLLLSLPAATRSAPPEPPETADSVSPVVPDVADEPLSDEEMDEPPDVPEPEPRKLIEIRIDDEGIRGIDEFGEEVVFEQSSRREREYRERERRYYEQERGLDEGNAAIVEIGSVYIEYDQEIDGSVISIQGDVTVDGVVDGDIFSRKTVRLGPDAIVTGNIVAKSLDSDPRADFQGRFIEFTIDPFPFRYDVDIGLPMLGSWIIETVVIAIIAFLVLLFFGRPVKRVRYQLETGFFKNFAVGFLIILAILPVFVLLCITIIGIPVAITAYPLALVGGLILGHIGAAYYIGILLGRMLSSLRFGSDFLRTIIGIVAIRASWLISGFFVVVDSEAMSIFFFVLGIVIQAVVAMAGLGAIWFSRFGTRPREVEATLPEPSPPHAEASAPAG